MAFARVQAAPKVTGGSATSIPITFSTPPTVGNGIIVPVVTWGGNLTGTTCADNRGNSYNVAVAFKHTGSAPGVVIAYCPKLVATGGPFTITVTVAAGIYWVGTAIEVSGVGSGLNVDRTVTRQDNSGTTFLTDSTAALFNDEVFACAVVSLGSGQGSLTVEGVSPAWTQEVEDLSFTWSVGEVDTRVLTGVVGTPQSCSWAGTTGTTSATALACFSAGVVVAAEVAVTQVPLEVAARLPTDLAVTQLLVEAAWQTRVLPATLDATQLLIEILHYDLGEPPTPPRPPRTSACPKTLPLDRER